jgi:hypothetical protein
VYRLATGDQGGVGEQDTEAREVAVVDEFGVSRDQFSMSR